jgi:iron(III) transport system substrate-binding protein
MRLSRFFQSLGLAGLCFFAAAASAQKTQLLVYTALETDQLKAYQEAFNRVEPNIEIKWVRDSTGVIIAKLLAEKANPQADVIWGVAASGLALFDQQGMLIPYAPLNLDAIMSQYRDKKNPPAWWGMNVYGATLCFNTVEAQKRNIPKPETWKDLLKPVYKGQVVMPNPASSGTGYFDVVAWLQMWGDDGGKGGGWKYMDALHENIAQYTHSGSKPCNMAAAGEIRGGHLLRVPRPQQQGQGRADRPGVPQGRASAGTWRPSPSTRAPRSSMRPRSWRTGPPARTR